MDPSKITVYVLDDNNVYVGTDIAHEFALAPGIYNVPFRSVTVEPTPKEGFNCVWETKHPPASLDFATKGQWRYVEVPEIDPVMPTVREDDPVVA